MDGMRIIGWVVGLMLLGGVIIFGLVQLNGGN